MTRVCLVGDDDVNLTYELLSRETARDALVAYDLREPYHNTVAVETVSLGAAVSLCNDLDWYLARFAEEALILEPSVSEREWLSRALATAVRDDRVDPDDTGRFLKVYGVEHPEAAADRGDGDADTDDGRPDSRSDGPSPPRLVEPMLVTRTGGTIPDYDLRPVAETVIVRVTESEFDA